MSQALFDEKGESDPRQDNGKCRISLTATGTEKCLTKDRDNQTANGECVGNGYSLSGQHFAEKVKIGNAALFDSDKGVPCLARRIKCCKTTRGQSIPANTSRSVRSRTLRVANFGLPRHKETYSYKLTAMDFSTEPASSYEEDNFVSNHACRGLFCKKIRRFVAAFRSNDSIYICLKFS